jgi:multisubunit Na+/H+ antiporter MnhB subunit
MPTTLPAVFLRLEALAVVVAAVALYFDGDYAAWAFFAFLLAPDLAFAGYLAGARVGAVVYNLAHTYVWPVALAAGCLLSGEAGLPVQIALIWAAHIGVDRILGYGLKYPTAFKDTHLGRV